ncbi:MAG: outer-membrane lipoprotein carrier protein LolA [Campylobacterales bacterium]|nr:outer-membrane lipoprotein carrier protein LolA [Campylobacterales bacterium]
MKLIFTVLVWSSVLFASIQVPENFQADFTQKITNPKKKVITYTGKIYFSNKNRLKWEYQSPTKKEVCTDGVEVLVVDHDLEQVSNYLINKGFDLAKILETAKPYKDKKSVFIAKHEGKEYTIQLDAKGKLSRVAYYDDLDNTILIIFEKMRYGKGDLPLKDIRCNFPENYDVIRE